MSNHETDPGEALDAIMLEWESLRGQGQDVDIELLCRDHPDLLSSVRREVRALGRFDRFTRPDIGAGSELADTISAREPGASLTLESSVMLLEPHARGGIGEIFRARDVTLNREVAIKFMRRRSTPTPAQMTRFLREAQVAARLEHPGSVPVYGLGRDADGRPCYAMRFIEGENLQSAIDRCHQAPPSKLFRGLEFRKLLARFVAVGNTVAYAHDRGILHRDLKPANIMLGHFGETLLVDWGLSKELHGAVESEAADATGQPPSTDSLTQTGVTLGTLAFMSPEQASGAASEIGSASDIYSLGATLFVLLTGQPPLRASSLVDAVSRIVQGKLPRSREIQPRVPRALDAICTHAMQLRPGDRYATALELVADVENYLADEPVKVHRESLAERLARILRRHRELVSLCAAFLVLSVIALSIGIWRIGLAQEKTLTAKRQAEKNLATARDAVDQLYTKVSMNRLLHEPGAELLRRDLLQAAKRYYERLQTEQDASGSLPLDVARASVRVADITADTESPAAAIPLFEHAVRGLREVSCRPAHSQDVQFELARALGAMGAALTNGEQLDRAERVFQDALAELMPLCQGAPDRQDYQSALGELLSNLAMARILRGASDEAMRTLAEAECVYRDAVQRDPQDVTALQGLCVVMTNRGVCLRMLGKTEYVAAAYQAAIVHAEKLVAVNPQDESFQDNLASAYYNLANHELAAGRLTDARAHQERALEIYRRLSAQFPLRYSFRIRLAKATHNLGAIYWTAKDYPQATSTYREAIDRYQRLATELAESPDVKAHLAKARNELEQLTAESQSPAESN